MVAYSCFYLLVDTARALARRQLVQRAGALPRAAAGARQHLHPLDPERAGGQGRDRALPEPEERRARLGARLEHALHHGLRALLPAALGHHRPRPPLGESSARPRGVPRACLSWPPRRASRRASRSGRFARRASPTRPGATARCSTRSARRGPGSTARSCCSARPRCSRACWSTRLRRACSGSRSRFAQMLCYLPLVIFGTLVPGPFRAVAVTMWPTLFPEHAAADDRVRLRPAQLLRAVQRGDRAAVPAEDEPGAFGAARRRSGA